MAGGDRLCDLAANEARYVEQLLDHGSYTDRVGKALTGAAAEMMTAASWSITTPVDGRPPAGTTRMPLKLPRLRATASLQLIVGSTHACCRTGRGSQEWETVCRSARWRRSLTITPPR
ncbi:hypothetical protein [Nocardia wallacei]|uniref:hypothetical protein n=1 Tax=Nocardia wallacei TaxID=480035 RepID=UPI00165742B4|nr:hypothetical protein [Nocardia wallacei]